MNIEEKKKKEYKYFISYFLSENKYEQAWGRAVVTLEKKIKEYRDILLIENLITGNDKNKKATLMNYILL